MLDLLVLLLPVILLWAVFFGVQWALFNDRQRRGVTLPPVKKTGHWSGL